MTDLTASTQAILLLVSPLSKYENDEEQPLLVAEWGLFAAWLYEHNMKPEDLLGKELEVKLKDWTNEKISISRLKYLLDRGASLALAMEKWHRVGLWIVTRSDKEYPQNIKKRLKHLSPPILYGIGNKSLLNSQSIAVVGSRDADYNTLHDAYKIGKKVTNDGLVLVSGGAKGVDEKAMQGALDHGGSGIVILAEDLLKNSLLSKYRNSLLQNNLVLISPYCPESPFNVANAMARNKYIYTLSIASVVVHSNAGGGTWTGANEAIKNSWAPLWVWESLDIKSSNTKLIEMGANMLTSKLLENHSSELRFFKVPSKSSASLFDAVKKEENQEVKTPVKFNAELSMYDFFVYKLKNTYSKESIFKPKDIEHLLKLKLSQINEWLITAEAENIIERLEGRVKKYMLKNC